MKWYIIFIVLLLVACEKPVDDKKTVATNTGGTGGSGGSGGSGESGGTETADDKEETLTGSLFDLGKLGRQIKCTIKDDRTKATIYVSGDKFRSTVVDQGEEFNTIGDGKYLYTWTPAGGSKIAYSYIEEQAEQSGEQVEGVKPDQDFDYSCRPWFPDKTKFVPPSNVDFVDMSEEIEKMKQDAKEMCPTCDEIPDPQAAADCKKALGC